MILTDWKHLKDFNSFIGKKVCDFIDNNDIHGISTGRYELGDDCYVNVDEYETRENFNFEAHREYADVQIMVEGDETVFVAPLKNGVEINPYSRENDVAFYSCKSVGYEIVNLVSGKALVMFPYDMHAPCNSNKKRINRKLVFKIPVKHIDTIIIGGKYNEKLL